MRNFLKRGATTLAAILIGSTALVTAPAFAQSAGVQMAQAERGEGGGRPEGRGGPRGGGG
ncbi:MAG: hypothetical protein JWN93_188, partial [Hyphomicrobiales bacterium]|nr:hypothetical protein [Hyphomicrobiales bacterium]